MEARSSQTSDKWCETSQRLKTQINNKQKWLLLYNDPMKIQISKMATDINIHGTIYSLTCNWNTLSLFKKKKKKIPALEITTKE